MNHIRQFLIGTACLISLVASAQWQWTDKDGRKVFSDRAPPTDVPEKNILKRPGARNAAAAAAEVPAPGAVAPEDGATPTPQATVTPPKLSGVDKELAERKKKAEEAEAAKRQAEEERITKAKVENCARAKQAKAGLESGRRIGRTNEKGQYEILDEAARAAEAKRIQSIIESDCGT